MGIKKFLVILAAGIMLLIVLAAWFLPLDEDFRMENPFWNGFRNLSASYPVQSLESFADNPVLSRGTKRIMVTNIRQT